MLLRACVEVTVESLTKEDRELLAARRLCDVNEPWLKDKLPKVLHRGRRVLVPVRLRALFEPVKRFGGQIFIGPWRLYVQELARAKVGSRYRATGSPSWAPKGYSCSTLTYWVFAFIGLSLPRYAIDQSYVGKPVKKPVPAGLVFYTNRFPIRDNDRVIGHVGITTKTGTLIHGSAREEKIVEVPLPEGSVLFTNPIPKEPHVLVLVPPRIDGVFTALDLARWLERPPLS